MSLQQAKTVTPMSNANGGKTRQEEKQQLKQLGVPDHFEGPTTYYQSDGEHSRSRESIQ